MKHHLIKVSEHTYPHKHYYYCEACHLNCWKSTKQLIAVHKFNESLINSFNDNYKKAPVISLVDNYKYNGARIQKNGNIYIMNVETGYVLYKVDCIFSKNDFLAKSIIE